MNQSETVIEVRNLVVEYGRGANTNQAVRNISFQIKKGESVGFIGANGAGKTSTIKVIMGFLFPAKGEALVFGDKAGSVQSRKRIGYLPEVALYYPFMKARELLELYGGLHGLNSRALKEKIPPLLDQLGLKDKGEVLLKNFSKGMQQRLGIAQAIIADPEALVFDELSSGLDPLGRYELRHVLLDLKQKGRTIFFSSHELTEVESLCDRVIMIHEGRIVTESPVADLMKPLNLFEIIFSLDSASMPPVVTKFNPTPEGDGYRVLIDDIAAYSEALSALASAGAVIRSASSKSRTLEEYFIELVGEKGEKQAV
ncbi:ABC transporter ATP-binding protein [Candidatus Sumerlaeota bacterium]|nr:ABC transporter ATP-binding protein [Candidatus Sumerlaeota bacterium]